MKIKWELTGGDPNDLKAVIGNDMLRVERMGRGIWWMAVYIEDDNRELMSGMLFPYLSTKLSAKWLAEAIYKLLKN